MELPNGETIAYRERVGGDKVLMLVHGNMVSSFAFDLVFENFDPSYKLIAPDFRGSGYSSYNKPFDSIHELADDFLALGDKLGLQKYSVLGWSTGGPVVMVMASKRPEAIDKVILVESASTRGYPLTRFDLEKNQVTAERLNTREAISGDVLRVIPYNNAYKNRDLGFLKTLYEAAVFSAGNIPSEERATAYYEDMCTQRNLIDVFHSLNHLNISSKNNGLHEGTGEADKITQPVLVFWGEKDLIIPRSMIDEIMEDIGDNARLVVFPETSHWPFVDKTFPEQLKLMQEFLDS
jgi:pimeloyl-ACP methyl ester carboxylesterase